MTYPLTPSCCLRVVVLVFTAVLGACQQAPEKQPEVQRLSMPELPVEGASRYLIDPASSELTIRVYRDGPLARFGHNHIVAATNLAGEVYRQSELNQSGFRLVINVSGLAVDRTVDRASAGDDFSAEVSAADIEGTRANMLGEALLDVTHFNDIELRSVAIKGELPDIDCVVRIRVRDTVSEWEFPARVQESDSKLVVEGVAGLSQRRLGLTPFSVMGGGLSVADQLEVHYRVIATPARPVSDNKLHPTAKTI